MHNTQEHLSTTHESKNMRQSDRYCIAALIFFCLAIFFLSVVLFTFNPQTLPGLLSTCIGVLLMLCCIVCFIRYRFYLKQEEESISP